MRESCENIVTGWMHHELPQHWFRLAKWLYDSAWKFYCMWIRDCNQTVEQLLYKTWGSLLDVIRYVNGFFFQFQGSACKHDRFYCVIYFEWSTHSYWNTHCFCEFEIDVSDLCFAYILLECFQTVINSFDLNVIYDTWFTIKTLVSKFRWLCIEIRKYKVYICMYHSGLLLCILVLTIFNEGAYLTVKSIFHYALNLF